MNSIQNSIERIRASFVVIRNNKVLLWYPLISVFATLGILALGIGGIVAISTTQTQLAHFELGAIIVGMMLLVSLVGIFASAIFYSAAMTALEGEKVSFKEAFRKTWQNRRALLLWWLFSAGVSLILMLLQGLLDKIPGLSKGTGWVIGRVVASMVNITWAFATYFTIPVLMTHPDTPIPTLKRSAELFKRSWGENVAGNVSFGILWLAVLILGGVVVMGINFLIYTINPDVPSIIFLIVYTSVVGPALIVMAILTTTAQSIFNASLYRYAETGDYVGPYTPKMFEQAFRRK